MLTACRPTTAGMRRDRAMMAVWDVLLPTSVAKPTTIFLSIVAVREGSAEHKLLERQLADPIKKLSKAAETTEKPAGEAAALVDEHTKDELLSLAKKADADVAASDTKAAIAEAIVEAGGPPEEKAPQRTTAESRARTEGRRQTGRSSKASRAEG